MDGWRKLAMAGAVSVAQTGGPSPATGAAPEPSQRALMLAGFGLLGAALRRRRSLAVAR